MDKQTTLDRIQQLGLVAVLRGPSPELTIKMVDALVAGGVKGIEITYSTPNAPQVVAELAKKYGDDIVLGMGTLTEPAQAEEAKAAGANYLVSPFFEPELARAMVATGLATMIGALTPSEIFAAYRAGSDVVKVFPGSAVGPSYIKAVKGPLPHIPMMPTGGVNAGNLADWFAAGVVAVGAGSELCPPKLAKEGKFDEITRTAADFVRAVEVARASVKK